MRDIVERLETHAFVADKTQNGMAPLFEECLEEIERLRAENDTLRRDVRTAVMGDSAELQDVKRENEKLRKALIDAAGELQHAYIMGFTERYRYAARAARNAVAAVRESGD